MNFRPTPEYMARLNAMVDADKKAPNPWRRRTPEEIAARRAQYAAARQRYATDADYRARIDSLTDALNETAQHTRHVGRN